MPQTENINIALSQPLMQELPIQIRLSRFAFLSLREYPIHTHLHMEIIYVLEGSLSIKVGVSNYTLSAGEFTIINPFELHGLYCTDEPNRICLLEISTQFYDPCQEGTIFVSDYNLYRDGAKDDFPKIEEVLRKIFHLHLSAMLAEDNPDGYLPVYSNAFNEEYEKILLRTLINYFELHFTSEYFLLSDHKENTLRDNFVQADRLKNILSYFYENYPRKIQLQDVADHTYVNRYHISHLVKSGIGFTFSELLQHIRIEKAEVYLLGTDLPISQIVFELGFSSYRYFNQHFKSLFQMTPNAYRQKYQKETILYKEISVLEPIPQAAAESLLMRWGALGQVDAPLGGPSEKDRCFLDLKKLLTQYEETHFAFEADDPSSDLNWPKEHMLYDSPYMASLLLSQIPPAGLFRFQKKHPCFTGRDDKSSEGAAPFQGLPGAVTDCGLRKASFYAFDFLHLLPDERCLTGPGYFFSCGGTASKRKAALLLFYAPFDIGELLSRRFSSPAALSTYVQGRIQGAKEKVFTLDFQDMLGNAHVSGPADAPWSRQLKLDLDPFVQWQRMGAPASLDKTTVEILNDAFQPDTCFLDPESPMEIALAPFDVKLFTFYL